MGVTTNGIDLEGARGRRERYLEAFEAAWDPAAPPDLAAFVPPDGPDRAAVLRELAATDLELRLKHGLPARAADYLARFPELAEPHAAAELAAWEAHLRQAHAAAETPVATQPPTPSVLRRMADPGDPTVPAPAPGPAVPPGFEVLGVLGKGGMGVVYQAVQVGLKRVVALKMVLDKGLGDRETLDRFRREAEAVARLQHPNIVQIFDYGTWGEIPWFALEFLPAGTLHRHWAGAPQAPEATARLVATLARAVQAAHDRGVIHRDLKPLNVLLGGAADAPWAACVPKVADFGLAKHLDADARLTHTAAAFGTPAYMSPEQATDASAVDGRTDVWALGAILYEGLTGRPPFKGPTALDTLDLVRTAEPVPPRRLQPRIPRDLETIGLKCLEKEPARRYATALALAEDLDRFLRHEPIRARPPGPAGRARKWVRRNPRLAAAAGAAVALSLLAGAGFGSWYLERLDRDAEEQRLAAREAALAHEAQGALDAGEAAFQAGRHDHAETHLAKALNLISGRALPDRVTSRERATFLLDQLRRFQDLETARRRALFHLLLAREFQLTDHRHAAQEQTALGLAQFPFDPAAGALRLPPAAPWREEDRQTIREGLFELLLLQAQLAAERGGEGQEQALRLADQADRLLTGALAPGLLRARWLEQRGRAAEAQRALAELATRQPRGAVDWFFLGAQAFAAGHWDQALGDFEAVLARAPGHFWGQYYIALTHLRRGDPSAARAAVTGCFAAAALPAEFRAWLLLLRANAATDLREFAAARADLVEAEEVLDAQTDPNARAILFLTWALLTAAAEGPAAALQVMEDELASPPSAVAAAVHTNRAKFAQDLGRWADAAASLEAALRLVPGGQDEPRQRLWYELGLVRQLLGNPDGAREAFGHALSPAAKVGAAAALALGRNLEKAGRLDEAIPEYERATQLAPGQFGAYGFLAGALLRRAGRADGATAARDRQAALDRLDAYQRAGGPPSTDLSRLRGLAHHGLGQAAAAVGAFTHALELERAAAARPAAALPPGLDLLLSAAAAGAAALPPGPALVTGLGLAPRHRAGTLLYLRSLAHGQAGAWALAEADAAAALQMLPGWPAAQEQQAVATVLLNRPARAVALAGALLPPGPVPPRRALAAARVLALAANQAQAQPPAGRPPAAEWRWQALDLLEAALAQLPTPAERRAFWTQVRRDQALQSLRRETAYLRVDRQFPPDG